MSENNYKLQSWSQTVWFRIEPVFPRMWIRYTHNYVTILSQILLVNIFQSSGSGRKLVLSTSRSCKYAVPFICTFTATWKLVLILLVSKWWPSKLCPSVWMSAQKVVVLGVPHFNDFEEFYQQHTKPLIFFFFLLSVFGFYFGSFNSCLDSLLTIIWRISWLRFFLYFFLSCKANARV